MQCPRSSGSSLKNTMLSFTPYLSPLPIFSCFYDNQNRGFLAFRHYTVLPLGSSIAITKSTPCVHELVSTQTPTLVNHKGPDRICQVPCACTIPPYKRHAPTVSPSRSYLSCPKDLFWHLLPSFLPFPNKHCMWALLYVSSSHLHCTTEHDNNDLSLTCVISSASSKDVQEIGSSKVWGFFFWLIL